MGGSDPHAVGERGGSHLPAGVQRVVAVLQARGHAHAPVMLDDAARTAQQASDALGIAVGQIAKSIVFRRLSDEAAVLVVTSGDRRVSESKVAARVGPLGRANAAFVRERTGFSIGGVAPVGHTTPVVTLIDQDLFRFGEVWAAAGHPHAVFRLLPGDLVRLTAAPVVDVVEPPEVPDGHAELLARQVAIKTLASRAISVRTATENLPSPCVSVCRMDTRSGLCEGCFRTIDEIRDWSSSDDAIKKTIWADITQRLLQAHPAALTGAWV
jgi:prolyl-tRNA editing enzyme YbaK/EbsC (Cys-tRNA(Pro) deacylase)/predicted Fe-S protein YdhL (DUF1289 family)